MFQSFYQLREQPFGVNPDPHFLYLSRTHREAFSSLLYRIQMDSGFLAMIAPPGMGKTTLLFHLLHRLQPTAKTAFIFQTQCTSGELLRNLLSEFECDIDAADTVLLFRKLKSFLVAEANAGRRCVLIIDEAQNLSPEVLETVRLLSNFETPRRKLLNIVLSGQAELGDMLSSIGMRQFRQRLSCISYLQEFTPVETSLYIAHRLEVAGYTGELSDLFSVHSLARIAYLSQGVPRVINNLCFNALSLGYALESKQVDVAMIDEVADDLGILRSQRPHLWQSEQNYETQFADTANQPHRDHAAAESDILSAVATYQEKKAARLAETKTSAPSAFAIQSDRCEAEIGRLGANQSSLEATASEIYHPAPIQEPESFIAKTSEPAQPVLEPQVPTKVPEAHRRSKNQFLARSLVCILVLCVAPVSGIQSHENTLAKTSVEDSTSIAGRTPEKAITPAHSPRLSGARIPARAGHQHRLNKEQARSRQLDRLRRERYKGMTVDLALATFAPEPLIEATPVHPISEPIISTSNRLQPKAPDTLIAETSPSIPQNPHLSSIYIPPKPIWQPAPTYEPALRSRYSSREVQLMLSISSNGDVYKADILKGNGRLARAAERAAETWKYSPAISNGVPVNSQVYVTIQFQQH